MKRQRKYNVWINSKKNRLFFELNGFFSENNINDVMSTIMHKAKLLSPYYEVIGDITKLKPFSENVGNEIERTMFFLKKRGVGKIVLVTDFSLMSYTQFEKVLENIGCSMDFSPTIEQAQQRLDTLGLFIP